jgi:cytochrome c-type biogenesis protein CcmH
VIKRLVLLLTASLFFISSVAVHSDEAERVTFKSEQSKADYTVLVNELRCLVCQNQTIADSDADLAKDLRAKVFTMVEAGQSRSDVIDYMTTRYGDFVLYRPAFKIKTLLLWLGPIVFLLLAIFFVIRWVRGQSSETPASTLNEAQRASVRDLLNKTD